MLITKTEPVGIDFYIQQLQAKLHTQLLTKWELITNEQKAKYHCYGRAYRNKTDNGYIAEVFTGNKEYKEVYWNDTLYAISFFGVSNIKAESTGNSADIHLVYFTQLGSLKPAITHRADEEVRNDVTSIIGNSSFGFSFLGVDLWLENVLKEYPGSRRDDRLKFVDMHPVHCFRINLKLLYNPNKIC